MGIPWKRVRVALALAVAFTLLTPGQSHAGLFRIVKNIGRGVRQEVQQTLGIARKQKIRTRRTVHRETRRARADVRKAFTGAQNNFARSGHYNKTQAKQTGHTFKSEITPTGKRLQAQGRTIQRDYRAKGEELKHRYSRTNKGK